MNKSIGDKPLSEMTYREVLIGMALQGLLASSHAEHTLSTIAPAAVAYADSVIARLDNEHKETAE